MASVRDIAKRSGVSITTVSRVLNNHPNVSADVREAVLAAAHRSRYVQSVGRRSTNNIALVYTGDRSLGSPFDANLLHGITNALDDTDLDLLILETRRARQNDEAYSHMFMRKGVRGAILRTTLASREICSAIAAEGFPVVVVGDRFPDPKTPSIWSDSATASREATEHLIGLGHRRIAICMNIVDDSDHVDRLSGYKEALAAHGIEADEQLVWRIPADRRGGFQVIRRLQAMAEAPTAVYITDPLTCVGALAEARRVGVRIPQDLSIVGFDDGDLRNTLCPQLTAVCQNAMELGSEAFTMLEKLMSDKPAKKAAGNSLKCWFEIHETTCPRG